MPFIERFTIKTDDLKDNNGMLENTNCIVAIY